jgi:flagellar basal-body rod protein FlgB
MQVGFLDFYGGVLGVREDRSALLADNIANAATPNYKALDVPFDAALAAQLGGTDGSGGQTGAAATDPSQIDPSQTDPSQTGSAQAGSSQVAPEYRADATVALNGNDVSLDTERVETAANGEAMAGAVTFLRQSTVDLVTALRPNPAGN